MGFKRKVNHWWEGPPGQPILKSFILSLVFLGCHGLFERTDIGKDFKVFEGQLLQTMLEFAHNPDYLPIIINISQIRKTDAPVDRVQLNVLIHRLHEKLVRAIGIDIDFSPLDNGRPVTPDDWSYFSSWGQLTKDGSFSLRLGVHRRALDPPAFWLGRDEFRKLAAGMARPTSDSDHNLAYVALKGQRVPDDDRLLEMSAALYRDVRKKDVPGTLILHESGTDLDRLTLDSYRVDYSDALLNLLALNTVDYSKPGDLDTVERTRKLEFRGRVVLIGDTTALDDQFCRPFTSAPIAGVIAHAASLVTLRQGGLNEITYPVTAYIDVAFALLGSGLLFIYARHGSSRPKQRQGLEHNVSTNTHQLEKQLDLIEIVWCILSALFVGAVGLFIVRMYRIFWPDFLWVSAALFMHPFVSATFLPFFWELSMAIRRMFSRALPTPKGASHA